METIIKKHKRGTNAKALCECDARYGDTIKPPQFMAEVERKKINKQTGCELLSTIQICLHFTFILITVNSGKNMRSDEFTHCRTQQLELLLLFLIQINNHNGRGGDQRLQMR